MKSVTNREVEGLILSGGEKMKRFVSIILAVLMLGSVFTVSASAQLRDDEGIELFREYAGTDDVVYKALGTVEGYTYAYGYSSDITDSSYFTRLGGYLFSKWGVAMPYGLALYIISDKMVYPLETAVGMELISKDGIEQAAQLTNDGAYAHKMTDNENLLYDYLTQNSLMNSWFYTFQEIGEIGGTTFVLGQTNKTDYVEKIDGYEVTSEQNEFLFSRGVKAFFIRDGEVYTLTEACENKFFTVEEAAKLYADSTNNQIHFIYVGESGENTSAPVTTSPVTEPVTTAPVTTEPVTTEPVTEPLSEPVTSATQEVTEPDSTQPDSTDSSDSSEPVTTTSSKTDKEIFEEYIKGIYHGSMGVMTYQELGEVNGAKLIKGLSSEMTDTFVNAHIGDYMFSKFYVAMPYDLALFIIKDGMVYSLEQAYSMEIITDDDFDELVPLAKNAVTVRKLEGKEKQMLSYLEKNGLFSRGRYSFTDVGELDGYSLVQAQTNGDSWDIRIGDYRIQTQPDMFMFNAGLRLYLMNSSEIIPLEKACEDGITTIEKAGELYHSSGTLGLTIMPFVEEPTTEPVTDEYARLKRTVIIGNPELGFDDIIVSSYKHIKGDLYLVRYTIKNTSYAADMPRSYFGRYCYTSSRPQELIYDDTYMKLYPIASAYNQKVIGDSDISVIRKLLSKTSSITVNAVSLKAGAQSQLAQATGVKISSAKSSDSKVASVTKGGAVTALTKGTATVTLTFADKTKVSFKVTVSSNPFLKRSGKDFKSATLKKGKKISVNVVGRASGTKLVCPKNNRVLIKASSDGKRITITAKKSGKTTAYVKVNGKKLTFRINVK